MRHARGGFSNFGLGGGSGARRAGWLNFGNVLSGFTLLGWSEIVVIDVALGGVRLAQFAPASHQHLNRRLGEGAPAPWGGCGFGGGSGLVFGKDLSELLLVNLVQERNPLVLGQGEVVILQAEEGFVVLRALLGEWDCGSACVGLWIRFTRPRCVGDLGLPQGGKVFLPAGGDGAGGEIAREGFLFDVVPVFGGAGLWGLGGV